MRWHPVFSRLITNLTLLSLLQGSLQLPSAASDARGSDVAIHSIDESAVSVAIDPRSCQSGNLQWSLRSVSAFDRISTALSAQSQPDKVRYCFLLERRAVDRPGRVVASLQAQHCLLTV